MKKIFRALTSLGVASVSLSPIAMISSQSKDSKPLSDEPKKISDSSDSLKETKKLNEVESLRNEIERLNAQVEKFKSLGRRLWKLWQGTTKSYAAIIEAHKWLSGRFEKMKNEKNQEIIDLQEKLDCLRNEIKKEFKRESDRKIHRLKANHNEEILKNQQEFDDYVKKQRIIEDRNLIRISKQNTMIDKLIHRIVVLESQVKN